MRGRRCRWSAWLLLNVLPAVLCLLGALLHTALLKDSRGRGSSL